jgi:hypothetical protein
MDELSNATLVCRQCGQVLKPSQRLYCSHRCMGDALRRGSPISCVQCGRSFYAAPAHVADGRRYCSRACSDAAKLKHDRPRHVPCLVCGEATKEHGGAHQPKYCSRRCVAEARRRASAERQRVLICAQCGGRRPLPLRSRLRYCSARCASLARRRSETRVCAAPGCETTLSVQPHQRAVGRRRYCSRACSDRGRRRGNMRPCVRCGRMFYLQGIHIKRNRQYCSRACWRGDGGRRSVQCQHCGLGIERWACQLEMGRGKFCSRECYYQARRKPRERRQCAYLGCRKLFEVPPWQSKRKYHSRQCYFRHYTPGTYRCAGCGQEFQQRRWRKPRFCSRACAQMPGSRRDWRREQARDQQILRLHGQGLKSPAIQNQMAAANPAWWISTAAIRQVIHRAAAVQGTVTRPRTRKLSQ